MKRACDSCGNDYEAKRASSKFCSTLCRMRAHRSAANASSQPPSSDTDEERTAPADVTRTTRLELEAADAVDSTLGQLALKLAHRIDTGNRADSAAGVTAMSKELRTLLDLATGRTTSAADPLDQLKARRHAKRAG